MRSETPKHLHPLLGRRMVDWVIAAARDTGAALRLCPERWLGKATHDDLRESLAPLLDLPVTRVLVSHGEPVLRDGAAAIRAALGPS